MPRAVCGLLAAALLLATTSLSSAEHVTGPPPGGLGCGSLAPFENSCDDPREFHISAHPRPYFNVLGFVGTMQISLVHEDPLESGRLIWTCVAFGGNFSAGPLATVDCEPPRIEGDLGIPPTPSGRGPLVALECRVSPYPLAGMPLLGPAGPWGCRVTL